LANHKSAIKRARQNELRRLRNRTVKTRCKSLVKDVRQTVEKAESEKLPELFLAAQSAIDKAAKRGVLHHRAAARKISRLAKLAQSRQS
jgi:small subunit ribosomal protein S20